MVDEHQMMTMRSVSAADRKPVVFLLNLLRRELCIYFTLDIEDIKARRIVSQEYKFVVQLHQVDSIWRRTLDRQHLELILPLKVPPPFYRRHEEIDASHESAGRFWKDDFAWYRQTDIPYDTANAKEPFTLRKPHADIDIGRWTTYRMVFDFHRFHNGDGMKLFDVLTDYNVHLRDPGPLTMIPRRVYSGWDFIDISTDSTLMFKEGALGVVHLHFAVRYQLEVCLSQGLLNEFNITKDFLNQLSQMDERPATRRLEHLADLGKRIFDPMEVLALAPRPSPWSKLPKHLVLVRTATVTPSTIRYSSPTVETSNRVVRHFSNYADRFLRVRFADEQFMGKIFSRGDNSLDAIYTRIKRCLTIGIQIGDRTYRYLGAGNSQFREHGAYFFAPTPDLTIQDVQSWMGDFDEIKFIAKHASRIGQCFSTTRAITSVPVNIREIDDIEHDGYNFTDGVGMISKFLAQSIAMELGLPDASDDPPAVFQFRLGGYKGVFAVSPEARARDVCVRPSQRKFSSNYQALEIIRWSSYSPPQLNRQLITVLTALGVDGSVFLEKMRVQLASYVRAMKEPESAISLLQKKIDPNQVTLNIARMVMDGFMDRKDPFTMSILQLWRAWSHKNLKEKASIDIEQGAFVLGCVDETGTLKGHFDAVQQKRGLSKQEILEALPEIFLSIKRPEPGSQHEIIEGICVLARNPSLHPGDIRVVRAVNVPALRHIYNAVVFPQTGNRDLPSMCSGGDLDGDDFFVSVSRFRSQIDNGALSC